MTEEKLKEANKLSRNINYLKLMYDHKTSVENFVIKEVIECLGDDFYKLVRNKYEELKKKLEMI